MLNIPSEVKAKFKSDICQKELKIVVNGVTCTNEDIYKDSFKLTETVMDGKVEFVGCISSILEVKISTLKLPKADYHGCPINVSVAVYLDNNTLSSYIPLFNGTVETCEKSADGHWQTLTCYDILAYFSDTPAYNEYKAAFNGGTVTLASFRASVMGDLGINEETQILPNDAVKFRKRYRNKDLTAMSLIRHITQINGAFGIINRSGNFEYRWIDDGADPEDVPYYRSLEYSDQTITPINTGLNIRTNTNDAGITVTRSEYQQYVGTDPGWSDESTDTYLVDDDDEDITEGNYVIESNLIAYKLNKNKKKVIAANIMAKVGFDAVFRNYKVVCNGLPYVECCDKVRFTKADGSQIGFVVLKRTLQGVQNMTDTYECAPTQETVQTGSGISSTASSYVSNVANSTLGMSGSPDEALGLVEKSITVNGTYAATEDGAEGYSQVTVDVEGGKTPGHYLSWAQNDEIPTATRGAVVIVKNNRFHCIYNTIYYYSDDEGHTWTQGTSLPYQFLNSKACVVFNDKIFCFGSTYASSSYQTYVLIGDDSGGTQAMNWESVNIGVNCAWYRTSADYTYGGLAIVYNDRIHIVTAGIHYESSADGRSYYFKDRIYDHGTMVYNTDMGLLVEMEGALHILGGYGGYHNRHWIYSGSDWVEQETLTYPVYGCGGGMFDGELYISTDPYVIFETWASQFVTGISVYVLEDNIFKMENVPFYKTLQSGDYRFRAFLYGCNIFEHNGKLYCMGVSPSAAESVRGFCVAEKIELN